MKYLDTINYIAATGGGILGGWLCGDHWTHGRPLSHGIVISIFTIVIVLNRIAQHTK